MEYNVSQEKKKLSRNYLRWLYGHRRNFLGQLYRYEKPACRLLKTSQESREWLIFSKQSYHLLISSPLAPFQKECETNPGRKQKNAAVFANRCSRRKVKITSPTEVTAVSTTTLRHEFFSEYCTKIVYAAFPLKIFCPHSSEECKDKLLTVFIWLEVAAYNVFFLSSRASYSQEHLTNECGLPLFAVGYRKVWMTLNLSLATFCGANSLFAFFFMS